ncbi:hypothetical protein Anapl_02359 [Anas platyrhynchos]|uniref:Uncharacterized protein n=1 Tax=Anas platyrhynchos TaxID=8839 RepID=R0LHT6_ANAPL|nr:hypothetical protein Anapl_02359 [Anas platyrhynchos]
MSYVRARAELRSHSEIQIHQLAEELQRLTIEEKGSERKEEENKSQATDVQRPCTLICKQPPAGAPLPCQNSNKTQCGRGHQSLHGPPLLVLAQFCEEGCEAGSFHYRWKSEQLMCTCNAPRVKQQNLPDCTLIAIQSNTNYGQGSGVNKRVSATFHSWFGKPVPPAVEIGLGLRDGTFGVPVPPFLESPVPITVFGGCTKTCLHRRSGSSGERLNTLCWPLLPKQEKDPPQPAAPGSRTELGKQTQGLAQHLVLQPGREDADGDHLISQKEKLRGARLACQVQDQLQLLSGHLGLRQERVLQVPALGNSRLWTEAMTCVDDCGSAGTDSRGRMKPKGLLQIEHGNRERNMQEEGVWAPLQQAACPCSVTPLNLAQQMAFSKLT